VEESATLTFRLDKPFFTMKVESGGSSDTLAAPVPDNMASHHTIHQYLSLIDEGGVKESHAKLQLVTHT
jgi:hypothetical protein